MQPGELGRVGDALLVGCGEAGDRTATALELIEVQLEGKKRISGEAFANGQRLADNESAGELS